MKHSRKFFLVMLFVALNALLVSLPAQAGVSCHKINARGTGQDHGDFTTEAQIRGGGLLQGTTTAAFAPTGQVGTVVSFAGTVTFTTNKATLTVSVTGTLDIATGAFSSSGPVTASTGKLAGATGNLTLNGVENLSTGAFTETIDGQICVDLSP